MKPQSHKPSVLRDKTLELAIRIVNLNKHLVREKNELIISKQILRSGTNPGAMVREATNAESGIDFIHKLSIAQKEAGETLYWLELLYKTQYITQSEFESISADTEAVLRMLSSSILTRKKSLAIKASSVLLAFIVSCLAFSTF
ncbi:four helix bundle protein [Fibrella aquatilis]|uniref:Four helix bundle protein n=1 Tax=Fibrella aquatilis TaxID=2817059 RepID=A0A939JXU5_9BACT|nr:four helix bundle protein [Fibrella aquatilis]MBO0933337.1 four helix bundle protein [Fibrella aquatilis]